MSEELRALGKYLRGELGPQHKIDMLIIDEVFDCAPKIPPEVMEKFRAKLERDIAEGKVCIFPPLTVQPMPPSKLSKAERLQKIYEIAKDPCVRLEIELFGPQFVAKERTPWQGNMTIRR